MQMLSKHCCHVGQRCRTAYAVNLLVLDIGVMNTWSQPVRPWEALNATHPIIYKFKGMMQTIAFLRVLLNVKYTVWFDWHLAMCLFLVQWILGCMASHRSHNTIWFNFPINDIKWRKTWLRMCTYHVASICCEWVLFIAGNRWSGRQIFPTCPTIVRLFGHDERKNGQGVCVPALLVFPTCVVMKLCGDVIICVRHIVLLPVSVYNTPDQCSPSTWYHPAYKMSNLKYQTLNFRWQVSCTRHEYPKLNFWTTESNQFIFVPSDQTLNHSPSTKHCEPETNRVLHVVAMKVFNKAY